MPRPCQQRRASAVANRKSKPSKPAGPPPIRHKAKQKAIHNARRGRGGRGGRRGGRGGSDGGRFSQDRARRDQQRGGNTMDQDFVPLSLGGNEFNALYRAREYTEYTDESSLDMDWPFNTDSETDSDDISDEDMYDSDDIAINVQATLPVTGRSSRPARAQVMFTVAAAVDIFETMRRSKYPLNVLTTRTRYDLFQVDTSPDSGAYISVAPSPASRRLSGSSATSEEAAAAPKVAAASEASIAPEVPPSQAETYNPARETYNPALAYNRGRDYVFDWGVKKGQRFHDVYADKTHNYLDSIAGKLYTYKGKHPGLEEAFEYYMPGKARLEPPGQKVLPQPPPFTPRGPSNPSSNGRCLKVAPSGPSRGAPSGPSKGAPSGPSRGVPSGPSRGASSGPSSGPSSSLSISDTWKFPKGMHKGSRLHEVPSGYIKSVESNSQTQKSWPGFVEALRDFKGKGLMV